jgi:hypothetical protein
MSDIEIQVRYDRKRGCGWRKPGGKYLMGGKLCAPCGKLPVWLSQCPVCGHGIKPMRGWRWINVCLLMQVAVCRFAAQGASCRRLCGRIGSLGRIRRPAGLVWIGETLHTPGVHRGGGPADLKKVACVPGIQGRRDAGPAAS